MGTLPWHSRLSQEATQTTFLGPHQSPSLALDIQTHIGPLLPHPPAGVTQAPETQHRGHQLQAVFRSSGLLSATIHSALSLCWEEGSGHSLLSLLPWMPWLEQWVNPCRVLTAGVVRALGWSWGGTSRLPPARWPKVGEPSRNGAEDWKQAANSSTCRRPPFPPGSPPWKQRGSNSAPKGVQAISGLNGWAS